MEGLGSNTWMGFRLVGNWLACLHSDDPSGMGRWFNRQGRQDAKKNS